MQLFCGLLISDVLLKQSYFLFKLQASSLELFFFFNNLLEAKEMVSNGLDLLLPNLSSQPSLYFAQKIWISDILKIFQQYFRMVLRGEDRVSQHFNVLDLRVNAA